MIPAVRLAEEAPRLRPLKVRPEELALRIPVYVGPTGTVLHDGHAYSMPPEAISMPGTLYLYADRVRILAGRHEAVHPRKFAPQEGSTLAAHRAALVAAVSGKRGQRYLKRQQLLELGEPAFRYLTEIVHRRPREWVGEVDRLHASSAEPWPRGFATRHGGGPQGGGLQCLLRGGLPATLAGFPGGDVMKTPALRAEVRKVGGGVRPPPSLWECGNRALGFGARFPSAVGRVEKSGFSAALSSSSAGLFHAFHGASFPQRLSPNAFDLGARGETDRCGGGWGLANPNPSRKTFSREVKR